MSWLISRALMQDFENSRSSLGLVEAFSEDTCLDGEPSAPSSENPMPQAYLSPDRMTAFCRLSRFGMTFAPLTAGRGEELLTWCLEGFPARTYPSQEKAQESTESGQDSGEKCRGSWVRYDPDSCSWRTAQCSLLEGSDEFSGTWPRSGLMRRGECYPLLTSAHRTCANESGSWPTPKSSDGAKGGPNQRHGTGSATLPAMVAKFPTPTTQDNNQVAGQYANPKSTTTLGGFFRMFPTATATAGKGWSAGHNRADTDDRLDYTIEREANQSGQSGRLNPGFCEWLMGWPLGWTELKPSEMDKSRFVQQQRLWNWKECFGYE